MGFQPIKRTGSYPLHDSDFVPHPDHDLAVFDDPQVRLPRTIRALREAHESKRHPRTVVICLDGTGDRFDNDNSNIVHFVSCLKKHSPQDQVTYYQSGIGTYDQGGLQNGFRAAMDMAVGSGLGTHIRDAYKFLMQNYQDGDKICLLGFSRGAYTIRCLAGMLHKVGLLPASNTSQIEFAYDFYKDDSEEGWKMSAEFKKTFCTDVDVYFVGLWDCVASVGFIPRTLPFSKSPTNSIHYFRHAMALDERRAKFKVLQWQQDQLDTKRQVASHATTSHHRYHAIFDLLAWMDWLLNTVFHIVGLMFSRLVMHRPRTAHQREFNKPNTRSPLQERDKNGSMLVNGFRDEANGSRNENLDAKFNAQERANKLAESFETDVLEVWFRGAHADVGGGAVHNESRHMLSRIPLRWMLRQCFECNTGILFDTARLAEMGLDVLTMWPTYKQPRKPVAGPQPSLLHKYHKRILAPLKRRSIFLPIGPKDETIDNAPTDQDLSYILPSESTEDYFDAMAPLNDQLVDAKGWWILEFWPVNIRVISKDGNGWDKKISMNLGRYRAVREQDPRLHWTVKYMSDEKMYTIRARTNKSVVWEEVF